MPGEEVMERGEGVKRKNYCHYCGGDSYRDRNCDCSYRYMRKGQAGVEHSTTTPHTVDELRETLASVAKHAEQDRLCLFKVSVTYIDPSKSAAPKEQSK